MEEISSKIAHAFGRLKRAVGDGPGILIRTKCKVHKAVILGTLLYSAETWITMQSHINRLVISFAVL